MFDSDSIDHLSQVFAKVWEEKTVREERKYELADFRRPGGVPSDSSTGGWLDPFNPTPDRSMPLPPLEELSPGSGLARLLEGIDRSRTSGYDLVHMIQALWRQITHYQGLFYSAVAELATLDQPEPDSQGAAELAAALHLTRAASETEYWLAVALSQHPDLLEGLLSGSIDLRRVKVILDHIESLEPDQGRDVVVQVLPSAPELTTGQLRSRLRRMVANIDPAAARARYQARLEDRRLVVEANPDGTANLLVMNAQPDLVTAARARIEELVRSLRGPDDVRTIDQLRADLVLDILNGGTGVGDGRAVVDIVVDLPTLIGLSETPGEIPGFGPVIAEVARKTVLDQPDCRWEFTVTDQGQPVATGTISRRPTRGLGRQIRARYHTCVFPGCRHPARRSDLDHTKAWVDNGSTSTGNLAPLCRYHHRLKDRGWFYGRDPDGSIVWTSPTGHVYPTTTLPP